VVPLDVGQDSGVRSQESEVRNQNAVILRSLALRDDGGSLQLGFAFRRQNGTLGEISPCPLCLASFNTEHTEHLSDLRVEFALETEDTETLTTREALRMAGRGDLTADS